MVYSNKSRLAGIVAFGIFVVFVSMACGIFFSSPRSTTPQPIESVETVVVLPSTEVAPSFTSDEEANLVELYARVNPAVVNITVYVSQGDNVLPLAQGSGFIYDSQGHIVTNAHVIHGVDEVEVTFADATMRTAEIVGEDLHSDLAVIKIESLPEGVQPVPLGNMESLAVGQTVVAIGNPFGYEGTLTRGIISALGRNIPTLTQFSIPQSIQTDAAINPGSSGGPLLNLQGEVIGVNAQISIDGATESNLGVGFAIPVSIIRLVVPDLIAKGEHQWSWLGVRGGSLNPTLVEAMDLKVDRGAYLAEILENGPAAKARLAGADEQITVNGRLIAVGGDVITEIDGQPVRSFDDLLIYVALNTQPGQTVTLTILRDGEFEQFDVTLERRPADMSTFENP